MNTRRTRSRATIFFSLFILLIVFLFTFVLVSSKQQDSRILSNSESSAITSLKNSSRELVDVTAIVDKGIISDRNSQYKTIEEAQQWLAANIVYERDPVLYGVEDFWAPCGLTNNLAAGDCEDYAICAAVLLADNIDRGYLVYLKSSDSKKAHVVFIYKVQEHWGINSNNQSEFRLPYFSTMQSALQDSLGEEYNDYVVYDYSKVDLIGGNDDLKQKLKRIEEHKLW